MGRVVKVSSVVLLFIVFLSPVWAMVPNLVEQKGVGSAVFYTLLSCSLFLAFASMLPFRVVIVVMLVCTPLASFEFVHVLVFDGYSSMAAVASFFETNPGEAYEFMHAYRYQLLFICLLLLPLIVITVISRSFIPSKVRIFSGGLLMITLSVFVIKTSVDIHKMNGGFVSGFEELSGRLWSYAYPFNFITKAYGYYSYRETLREAREEKKDFKFDAVYSGLIGDAPLVVLIIGETARRANWQLAGYSRETNPLLSDVENLNFFQDMITNATHTRESIQLSLSRATPQNLEKIKSEKTIVSAFKEAGYKTIWLSNQKQGGAIDTPITAIAKEADGQLFTNNESDFGSVFDGDMLDSFKVLLDEYSSHPLFVVIHTMGSHEVYRKRYPKEYEQFQPASRGDDYNFSSQNIRERLLNSYDNSILYTDYVLSSFLDQARITRRPSYIVYFSDHGENVLDDNSGRFGHGGVVPTKYVTDIPFFVWTSEEYLDLRPDLVGTLSTNTSKPYSLNSLFDTLLYGGGISLGGDLFYGVNGSHEEGERYLINTENMPVDYSTLR